jgi:hypothetical protein
VASSSSAPLVCLHNIVARHVKHAIGNSEVTRNFARTLKLNAAVSIRHTKDPNYIVIEIKMRISEGHIPGMSKGDFNFIGTIIEAERTLLETEGAFSMIFKTLEKKLAVLLINFLVCPPTKTILPPENFNFCKHHYDERLVAMWDQLRRDVDTLVQPTLVIWAQVQKGKSATSIFRVATTTSNDEPNELVLYEGAKCSC